MPKTLTLMRHGKSSWSYNVEDEFRPLKKRAFKDIVHVYANFHKHMKDETVYLSSSALRAKTTARELFKLGGLSEHKLTIDKRLYTFNPNTLQDIILSFDDSHSDIMIFGHNPAFTTIVNHYGDIEFDNVPTSGLVQLKFEADSWKDLKKGKTVLHLFPKNLR